MPDDEEAPEPQEPEPSERQPTTPMVAPLAESDRVEDLFNADGSIK